MFWIQRRIWFHGYALAESEDSYIISKPLSIDFVSLRGEWIIYAPKMEKYFSFKANLSPAADC